MEVNINDWMSVEASALSRHLHADGMYGRQGKAGHEQCAKEVGRCMADMGAADRSEFLQASYSAVYVRACDLKPVLNAKEWISIMIEAERQTKETAWLHTERGLAWRMSQA